MLHTINRLKSIKIKTWFTEEEVLKFSTFLFENGFNTNRIRGRAPKCTSLRPADNELVGLVKLFDFGSLTSRTYVFTGSKRLNKTHFEDEFGDQERLSIFRKKRQKMRIRDSLKSFQSLKYRMPILTWDGLLLLSGIHESTTSMLITDVSSGMLETKCVGDSFGMLVTDLRFWYTTR